MTDYSILTEKPEKFETIKVKCLEVTFNGIRTDGDFPEYVYIRPIHDGFFEADYVNNLLEKAFGESDLKVEYKEPTELQLGFPKCLFAWVTSKTFSSFDELNGKLDDIDMDGEGYHLQVDQNSSEPENGLWTTVIQVDIPESFDLD